MNTDVNVGWGPVTITGVVTAVTSGLFAIAAFLTTLTGSLPASVSDKYGFWLATAAGIISALAQAIVGASRVFFAKQKVNLVSNVAFANPAAVTADVGDSVVTYEDDPVISDTNVTPPVTPVS
jgi:ethanolamine transporter EutH